MSDDPRSTPLQDALARLDTHGEGFALDLDRHGAEVEARKELGKAWTVSGAASRAWSGAWNAVAKLTWKPKG